MGNHLRGRAPKKTGGFCWGRVVIDGVVVYRLFRRDQRGATHYFTLVYRPEELTRDPHIRTRIAHEINHARHALRDQVDDVDLALMGVE